MLKSISFLVLFCLIAGCAQTVKTQQPRVRLPGTAVFPQEENLSGLENIENKDLEEYAQKRGIVFAKTDFQGVLQTSYVQLHIDGKDKNTRSFNLNIEGNPDVKNSLFGSGKMVKPGYFFIELPAGLYRISSIAIPVGSTLAREDISVTFEVIPNSIVYLGTLRVIGINEKIKLGGVPVIRPGFDYKVQVLDERSEGLYAFHRRYPNVPVVIHTQLMRVE